MASKINLTANKTIVFIGDSITDADRNEPAYKPYGFGFVHFAANMLLARHPELNLNIINTGISGNTTRDLQGRWEKDCISHNPDILSVLIGINDLWRSYDSVNPSDAVPSDEYETIYRQLLSRAKQQCDCQFILAEPFMFCDDPDDPMFRQLRKYIRIVHELAKEFDAVLVPLQSCIDRQIKQIPAEKWSMDLVHPYLWAHAWIAQRWLESTSKT